MAMPSTRSAPSASTARCAVTAESIPPERPITAPGGRFCFQEVVADAEHEPAFELARRRRDPRPLVERPCRGRLGSSTDPRAAPRRAGSAAWSRRRSCVDHAGAAVEDELVVAAPLVHEDDGAIVASRHVGAWRGAPPALPTCHGEAEGSGSRRRPRSRAPPPGRRGRAAGLEPGVLADRDVRGNGRARRPGRSACGRAGLRRSSDSRRRRRRSGSRVFDCDGRGDDPPRTTYRGVVHRACRPARSTGHARPRWPGPISRRLPFSRVVEVGAAGRARIRRARAGPWAGSP